MDCIRRVIITFQFTCQWSAPCLFSQTQWSDPNGHRATWPIHHARIIIHMNKFLTNFWELPHEVDRFQPMQDLSDISCQFHDIAWNSCREHQVWRSSGKYSAIASKLNTKAHIQAFCPLHPKPKNLFYSNRSVLRSKWSLIRPGPDNQTWLALQLFSIVWTWLHPDQQYAAALSGKRLLAGSWPEPPIRGRGHNQSRWKKGLFIKCCTNGKPKTAVFRFRFGLSLWTSCLKEPKGNGLFSWTGVGIVKPMAVNLCKIESARQKDESVHYKSQMIFCPCFLTFLTMKKPVYVGVQ